MTRVKKIQERIDRAKKFAAFQIMVQYRLLVRSAEARLGEELFDLAEEIIAQAEKILLYEEIQQMAKSTDFTTYRTIISLLAAGETDEALELVLAW